MKKLLVTVTVLFSGVFAWAAGGQTYSTLGTFSSAQTPDESVVTVSSYAVTTSASVTRNAGVYREFMNTGNVDIKRYTVLSSSTTAGMTFIAPGAIWVEDRYMDDYYFSTPAGQSTSTLSIKTFKNR